MKLIILNVFISIITFSFCQENASYSPTSRSRNSFLHQMTFRNPVTFTPYEIKFGFVYNKGTLNWTKLVENDSIVNQSIKLKYNTGNIIELDLIRTNLPNLVFHQNYIDLQMGIGIQYINYSTNIESIGNNLPDSLGQLENGCNKGTCYFSPKGFGLNIHTTMSWQLFPNRITYLYYAMAFNKLTFYRSKLEENYLTGNGISTSLGVGTKVLFKNSKNNYRFYWGVEGKVNTISVTTSSDSDPKNISSITSLDLDGFTFSITAGIQFGGKRTDGDVAYSYMINSDFISAAQNFENFLSKEKRHGKRKKAIKMLQYCHSQIPSQQVDLGKKYMFDSNYTEAVEWFDAATSEANDDLKVEIQSHRKNIANEILDSVQNYRNEITIAEAEKLIMIALDLMPENKRANRILANLYYDKGILNTDIGNFSEAIANFSYALELYPPIETLVQEKLNQLIYLLTKDAYLAAKEKELRLVISSLETIIELNPELAQEWSSYIVKLETQIERHKRETGGRLVEEYIEKKQQETTRDYAHILQLGMTFKEVEKIWGTPTFIDEMNEANQYFQMWTYNTGLKITRLYFDNNKLVRIED